MMLDTLRGAVRPLLTLLGFVTFSWLVIKGVVSPGEYVVLVSGMVGYWFAERNQNHANGGAEEPGITPPAPPAPPAPPSPPPPDIPAIVKEANAQPARSPEEEWEREKGILLGLVASGKMSKEAADEMARGDLKALHDAYPYTTIPQPDGYTL